MMRRLVPVAAVGFLFAPGRADAQCSLTASDHCPNTAAPICRSSPKWKTNPVTFWMHDTGAEPDVPRATTESELRAAFNTWSSTIACSGIRFSFGGTFTTPSGLAAISSNESPNRNRLVWLNSGWQFGSGTLGVTTPVWWQGVNEIFDADIQFNNQSVTWNTTGNWPNIDVRSIVLHEGGHLWGAAHTQNFQDGAGALSVMYYAYQGGRIITPNSDDRAQICCLYPSTTPSGTQGDFCSATSNCQSGLVCAAAQGAVAGSAYICTVACPATCPSGYSCQAAQTNPTSAVSSACLIQPTTTPDMCAFCVTGQDCNSSYCLLTAAHRTYCTSTCTSTAQCGNAAYTCQTISGSGTQVCIASNATCPSGSLQCSGTKPCPSGFYCDSAQMCSWGPVGTRCDFDYFCTGGSAVAFCLDENDGTAWCRARCDTTPCASGFVCVTVVDQNKNPIGQACIPGNYAKIGEACAGTTGKTCEANAVCVGTTGSPNGTCRQSCDPASPNCPAGTSCVSLTGGGGACMPATVGPDAGTPGPDAGTPGPDAGTPGPDAGSGGGGPGTSCPIGPWQCSQSPKPQYCGYENGASVCRLACSTLNPCPTGQDCNFVYDKFGTLLGKACQPGTTPGPDAGTPAGDAGSTCPPDCFTPRPDAGPDAGTTTNGGTGCGCAAPGGGALGLVGLAAALRRRRRA